MGCDTVNGADNPEEWGFLLTHPVWDVTPNRTRKRPTMRKISTHTSRVGCDEDSEPIQNGHILISTHTSRVGCDDVIHIFQYLNLKFLLTHPVWDVTAIYSIFQSHYSHILQDGPIIHLELY